jgi:hypothetical protein
VESRRAIDVRLLAVAALAGVAVVAALIVGYVWGAGGGRVNSTPASKGPEGAAQSQGTDATESGPERQPSPGPRMRPPLPLAANSAGAEPPEPPTLSPEEGRRQHIARLTTSGPDTRGLLTDARRVGEDWENALAAERLGVTLGDWHCFKAGCFVEAKHASLETVEKATNVVTNSSAFMSWNGEKIRTGPVPLPDGKTDVVWILLPPAEGEAALPPELPNGTPTNRPPKSP